MAKTNGQTESNGAEIIARMALNGATIEQMAATAQALGYVLPNGSGKAAATAAPARPLPEWVKDARANLPAEPAKAQETQDRTIAPRIWAGPFDAGDSKALYPQVAFTTHNRKGGSFRVSFPLDLLLSIQQQAIDTATAPKS